MGIILWPFRAAWSLVGFILEATGRLVAAILGILLIVVGAVLTATVVGAIVGIPILLVGVSMFLRALF